MTFNNLKIMCDNAHVTVTKVAQEVGISYDGLKKGINQQSLSFRYIPQLCQSLGITPNQFFGYTDKKGVCQTQNGGVGNTQIVDQGIEALREQLRAKDEQINKLLNIISK